MNGSDPGLTLAEEQRLHTPREEPGIPCLP